MYSSENEIRMNPGEIKIVEVITPGHKQQAFHYFYFTLYTNVTYSKSKREYIDTWTYASVELNSIEFRIAWNIFDLYWHETLVE